MWCRGVIPPYWKDLQLKLVFQKLKTSNKQIRYLCVHSKWCEKSWSALALLWLQPISFILVQVKAVSGQGMVKRRYERARGLPQQGCAGHFL